MQDCLNTCLKERKYSWEFSSILYWQLGQLILRTKHCIDIPLSLSLDTPTVLFDVQSFHSIVYITNVPN